MRSRAAVVVAALALLLVAGTVALWLAGGDPNARSEASADELDGPPEWAEPFALDEDAAPARERERRRSERPASAARPFGPPEGREARREERRERWRRSVDIVPLGPSEPGFDADGLREALSPGGEALRQCVGEAGGWRVMREASRPPEGGGPPPRRTASFDVRPDGTVDPDTVGFTPPMPEPFDACFRTFFASARLDGVGADGARVEMPMGPRGRRRDLSGDAGVPGGRWRARGGERRRGRSE